MIIKKNYESALDVVKVTDPSEAKKKCPCLIDGVLHGLHHLTVGVSPNTVTVFYDFTTTTPKQPVIWGLGAHSGKNTEYIVNWDAKKTGKVTLK